MFWNWFNWEAENLVGMCHDSDSTDPKTRLMTPLTRSRSFFVIVDKLELLHLELDHQIVLDTEVLVTFIESI